MGAIEKKFRKQAPISARTAPRAAYRSAMPTGHGAWHGVARRAGPSLVTLLIIGIVAACGQSSGGATAVSQNSANAAGSATPSWLTAAKQTIADLLKVPTTIWSARLGKFTPPAHMSLYYVGSPPSAEGFTNFEEGVKAAAAVLGYTVKTCGGATPDQVSQCFSEAIAAKPDMILTNGTSRAANGADWARVKAAGIPMIASFAGDQTRSPEVVAEVAGGPHCTVAGTDLADGIIADTAGKANVVFFTESSYACNIATTNGFKAEISKCTTCTVKYVPFSITTMSSTFPQQILATIEQNPRANYMAGDWDGVSQLVSDAIRQSGRTDIKVGGVYGYSPNLADVRGGSQAFDIAHGRLEWGWVAVDGAARFKAGQRIPYYLEISKFDYTQATAQLVGSSYNGAVNYQQQFEALWGK